MLGEIPKLGPRLLNMASHEMAAAQNQTVLPGRKSARERVVSFLIMLSSASIRRARQGNVLPPPPLNRSDIADCLGLAVETVSRILARLKMERLIRHLDGKEVHLAIPESMREMAASF